jgi:hypothetical protein
MLSRRTFIKLAVAGGASLAAARVLYGPFESQPGAPEDTGRSYAALTPGSREILIAMLPVLLDGALPAGDAKHGAVRDLVRDIDASYALMPPAIRGELAQLYQLLAFPVTRRGLAGVMNPWHSAGDAELRAFVEHWRNGSLALFAKGYQALRSSAIGVWYGQDKAWPRIGYQGPAAYVAPQS